MKAVDAMTRNVVSVKLDYSVFEATHASSCESLANTDDINQSDASEEQERNGDLVEHIANKTDRAARVQAEQRNQLRTVLVTRCAAHPSGIRSSSDAFPRMTNSKPGPSTMKRRQTLTVTGMSSHVGRNQLARV